MIELTGHYDGLGLTELCRVVAVDGPHHVNGAHHAYYLHRALTSAESRTGEAGLTRSAGFINFQRGPRNEPGSTPGTLDGAVLSVLIHRQECFQAGPFACPENDEVLSHLTAARDLLIRRAQERATRGVLGKDEK